MNSMLALEEELHETSSIGFAVYKKHKVLYTPLALLQNVAANTEVLFTSEPIANCTYYITAPKVDISGYEYNLINHQRVRVTYKSRESIEVLLGDKGKLILKKIIDLIEGTAQKHNWPLSNIEVTYIEDTEVENWQYVLIAPVFDTDFENADKYLDKLYHELDVLAEALDSQGQEIMQRKVFFDVASTV